MGFLGIVGLVFAGTTEDPRKEGFLWVISDLSTCRRPAVTAVPLLRSAITAAAPEAGATGCAATPAGGGGGGGGGGGPPAEAAGPGPEY
jgi:hypothetical protein